MTTSSRNVIGVLLGSGVVAMPPWTIVTLGQAVFRPGFDFSRHTLSLLELDGWGWVKQLNFMVARTPGWSLLAIRGIARSRIGGATGDVYGATAELTHLSALIVFAAHR